jgi:cell division septal protein FtsQ
VCVCFSCLCLFRVEEKKKKRKKKTTTTTTTTKKRIFQKKKKKKKWRSSLRKWAVAGATQSYMCCWLGWLGAAVWLPLPLLLADAL